MFVGCGEVVWCGRGGGVVLVFFKQNTAYEMRISDWSSDVCSSDLVGHVDAGACEPGQRKAGCDARCRAFESRTQDRIAMATSAPLFQGAGGIARCSGDPDIVADARTDAPQRPARFDETERCNAHRKRSDRKSVV